MHEVWISSKKKCFFTATAYRSSLGPFIQVVLLTLCMAQINFLLKQEMVLVFILQGHAEENNPHLVSRVMRRLHVVACITMHILDSIVVLLPCVARASKTTTEQK